MPRKNVKKYKYRVCGYRRTIRNRSNLYDNSYTEEKGFYSSPMKVFPSD